MASEVGVGGRATTGFLTALLVVGGHGSLALADGPAGRVRANILDPERTELPRHDGRRRAFTVTLNPLAAAVARFGGNVEISPGPHHALVGSGYVQTFPAWMIRDLTGIEELDGRTTAAFGGEFGYRYYTGRRGSDGFFVGPSAIVMPLAYPRLEAGTVGRLVMAPNRDGAAQVMRGAVELEPFYAFGAALDVGVQKVMRSGFTIGGGLGVGYITYDVPADSLPIPSKYKMNVVPRVLFAAGWAF